MRNRQLGRRVLVTLLSNLRHVRNTAGLQLLQSRSVEVYGSPISLYYPAFFISCQRASLFRRVRGVTPSSAAASVLLP